jgi:hypothetical protein
MFSQKMQHHEMVRTATGCPAGRACEDLCSALSFSTCLCVSLLYIYLFVCVPCPRTPSVRAERGSRRVERPWDRWLRSVRKPHDGAHTWQPCTCSRQHTYTQPPPGTFGGTSGLGGADGFGGTGENNVMYAGGWPVSRVRARDCVVVVRWYCHRGPGA